MQPNPQLTISVDEEERDLIGAERAAVLLLALGQEHGAGIWENLDEIEIKQISIAMSKLGPVTPDMLDHLFKDFVKTLSAKGALLGNYDSTERILTSVLPAEKVATIMEEIRGPAGRNMWEKLSNVQENVLAQLSEERISTDGRRRAVENPLRTRRTGSFHSSRRIRDGSGQPHAADGVGAKGNPRKGRTDPARRVHVEPVDDQPARCA